MNALEIISILKTHKVVPRLVGDQLKLVGETGSLPGELIERIRAGKEELSAFLKAATDQSAFTPIPVVEQQASYPASNAQRRIWLLSQLEGGSAAYIIVRSFYLKGTVSKTNLEKAFQRCLQRHESLRTLFKEINGELRQIVSDQLSFRLDFFDISSIDDRRAYLQADQSATLPFDLGHGPLIRVRLFQMTAEEYAMIFSVHHIISDGWSINVLVREVMHSYEAFCKNEEWQLPPLKIQYKDYSQWHSGRIEGERGQQARQFWKSQFPSAPEPLNLPADLPRAAMRSFQGEVIRCYPGASLFARVLSFCKDNQVTTFNFFRATLSLLLSKLSGQQDITIGTPVSGRSHLDLEGQIGLYVNTLPLRMMIDPALTFLDFLKQVSIHSFKTFEFQDYPFDKMVEDLEIRRDLSRNPLFDVMMVLQNPAIGDGSVNKQQQYGFELNLLEKYLYPSGRPNVEKIAAKFDWTINFDYEPDNTFYIEIEYDSRLFRKAAIQRYFQSYLHLISQVIEGPDRYISAIDLVTPGEKQQILHTFNAPVAPIEEYSILSLLQPSFLFSQDETAIIVKDKRFSYRQLDAASDTIAHYLSSLPATEGSPFVGLLMLRSEKTLACIVGVLKAGLAYVPIDCHYPSSRIKYIIEDAGLTCILVDDRGHSLIPPDYSGRVILIKDIDLFGSPGPLAVRVKDNGDLREHTAYLIYTSGSTGKPKGVEICHRNVIAFLKWAHLEYAGTSFDILYAATSYCFDLSVFEFLFPLMEGKAIRILDSAVDITASATTEWIGGADKNIMLNTVPSVIRSLLEEGMDWSTISAINIAGEPVPESFKRSLDFSAIEVRNLYGPSEDTTYSTVYRFAADDYPTIPIGSPVGYSQLYIMDTYRNLLPVGVDGEIYLSGQSVAKGYLNQPVLTAERFLVNPFLPGLTMYKTGDLGRWTEDGKVLFAGRIDDQVKIRGYRIEPGEIQFQLEQHPGVDQAVVLVQEINGDQGIVAYIKGGPAASPSVLKTWLADRLPAYMIPGWWIRLEDIPVNNNGKVDRKKLPLPLMSPDLPAECIPPETGLQHSLLSLWKRVLGREELGITDNFFDKGGHSLKATKLKFLIANELGKDITLNELFSFATIERQAQLLESRSPAPVIKIPGATGLQEAPISLAQERLWVLTKFKDASVAYNMPAVFAVKGPLDADRLQAAFNHVIRRYEILRTVFTEKEGRPVQSILAPEDLGFALGRPADGKQLSHRQSLEELKKEWRKPFDLEKGPLIKAAIIETAQGQLLSFNMHHLISDGWSLGILYEQVAAAYRSLTEDDAIPPQVPALQYKDYAVWQRGQLTGDRLESHHLFWQEVFKDGVPVLELPTDFHRPPVKTYNGATANFRFSPSVSRKLYQLARRADVSLFMTLMAAVKVLLKKYTGQNTIVIGTPVSGRDHPQLQDQIGFYVNTLPIRTEIDPNASFLSLLREEKNNILRAFGHQTFPFEMLVEMLSLKRELSRSPLFDVMLVLQTEGDWAGGTDDHLAPNIQLQRLPAETGIAKYDLLFSFLEGKEVLECSLEYNTDLFREETVLRMIRHLDRLLFQVTASPEEKIKDIILVDETEVATLTSRADQSRVSYDKTATILSLFRQTVARYPDKTALVTDQTSLTYQELDTQSGQLTKILIEDYNLSPGELVLLCFGRNEWMLIAIFAVLKAGAAYVPVDPDYPPARTAYMLEDTASRLILTDHVPGPSLKPLQNDSPSHLHLANIRELVNIKELVYTGPVLEAAVQPSDLAYVIYTSGTTGTPKGVMIEHRQVTRLLFTEEGLFDFGPDDRWSLFHSYCFDFSVWEMYGALLNGATLVVVPKETAQNGHVFYDFLQKEKITVLNQTPTAFRSMLQANEGRITADDAFPAGSHRTAPPLLSVRYLIFGGEALMPGILAPWKKALPFCRIINMYGITETTVHVTYKEMTAAELTGNQSNIGIPIPTMSCYVLDADLRQVPIGVRGELCVGGAGVGRGYLNKPFLTADRFIGHPFMKDQRMYRSGDHARILSNGDMEYLGRTDDQVKIRGHRIELAEVATALLHRQEIKDAVVVPLKNAADEYELAAYFIPSESFEDPTRLRRQLMELLPAYMIPSFLIPLAQFPLNSNGKLDKDRLPGPNESGVAPTGHVAFRHDTDKKILEIWEEILEKQDIGIRDNFFDLGGHSLKATRVVSRIHEVFGIAIDLKTLFIEPTVEHLSNYIETIQWMEDKQFTMAEDENEIIF